VTEEITTDALESLDSTLVSSARQTIQQFLDSFVSFEPTLGLLFGEVSPSDDASGSWSLCAYDSQTAGELIESYERFGASVCFDLDGFRVLIPQLARVPLLRGVELDLVENRIRPV